MDRTLAWSLPPATAPAGLIWGCPCGDEKGWRLPERRRVLPWADLGLPLRGMKKARGFPTRWSSLRERRFGYQGTRSTSVRRISPLPAGFVNRPGLDARDPGPRAATERPCRCRRAGTPPVVSGGTQPGTLLPEVEPPVIDDRDDHRRRGRASAGRAARGWPSNTGSSIESAPNRAPARLPGTSRSAPGPPVGWPPPRVRVSAGSIFRR